jgi:hypothetical protein
MTYEPAIPKCLPTMVWGCDEDPIVLHEVVEAALSYDQLRALWDAGLSVIDVLAGNVPGLDPVEIVAGVWEECLEDDEYARCMGRLAELLAEYRRSGK